MDQRIVSTGKTHFNSSEFVHYLLPLCLNRAVVLMTVEQVCTIPEREKDGG